MLHKRWLKRNYARFQKVLCEEEEGGCGVTEELEGLQAEERAEDGLMLDLIS